MICSKGLEKALRSRTFLLFVSPRISAIAVSQTEPLDNRQVCRKRLPAGLWESEPLRVRAAVVRAGDAPARRRLLQGQVPLAYESWETSQD
jgi:hypothetical protein